MIWSGVLFGCLGVLIGLRYRAPILIPATCFALASGIVGGVALGYSFGEVVLLVLVLTFALHAAYLGGVALRTLSRR